MAGRRPLPTAVKELAGNPGKRPLNHAEPKPRKLKPKPPDTVKGNQSALKEWHRLIKILWPTGILTEAEADVLGLYCINLMHWQEAVAAVMESGMVIMSPKGYPIQNPYLSIANQTAKSMRALLAELGMTPASRSRIVVDDQKDGDSFDAFLSGAYTVQHEES